LKSLGASLVVLDAASRDGGGFRTRDALETLQTLPPVALALNGVGGASSASLAGSLADGGVMVTYGGMARAPAHVPTGAAIFNSVTATGFWLTRWSEDKRRAESLARRTRNGGSSGFAPDAISNLAFARARMFNRLVGMVDRGELSMPLRSVEIDGFVDALRAREGKVGEGKIALWMGR
jgi:NADPH:quinone reductase-like Zn-dependent oxidoreductase